MGWSPATNNQGAECSFRGVTRGLAPPRPPAEHPELTFEEAYAISIGKAPAPAKVHPAQQPETPPVVLALPAPEEVVTQMVTMTLPECFVYAPAKIKIVTEPQTLEPPEVALEAPPEAPARPED